jgi:cell division topological specificity factor
MRIFSFFRAPAKTPAAHAKERLQIVMAHERSGRSGPDFLPMLQQELLAVIAKYVDLDQNKVEVKLDRGNDCSTLEVNIELPSTEDAVKSALEAKAAKANGGATAKTGGGTADKPASTPKVVANVLANGGLKGRH